MVSKTMTGMDWIWTTVMVLAIAALIHQLVRKIRNKKLPPGPRGLPIIGHLHLLGKNPHQDLHKLVKKHGPIMYMRFGSVPAIIVSSAEAAERFLKTNDLVFASRPSLEASWYISYGQRNLVFAPYGPYWRNMRKFCTLQLFSNLKIDSFKSMRKEEICLFVESLKQAAQDRVVVDLSDKVLSLSADMTCRMLFGKKYTDEYFDQRGFKALIQEVMEVMATPNLGDYFPYLRKLDIQGLTRRATAISKVFDAFLEKIIDEHEQSINCSGQTKDFVDTILSFLKSGEAEFKFDRRHVKAILLDMLVASIDTSATVIDWTMSELLINPRVMTKVQKELEEVVGKNKMVEESDLNSLAYLDMVVKESFRLHSPVPLLYHESMEDCMVDRFLIPNKSRIFINVWAIGRDTNAWTDPEKFVPERFIKSKIDVQGRDFQLIPFGAGRRICPGIQLGLIVVRLVIAQLVHCFDWKLSNDIMMPTDLDMTEHFGVVLSRAKNLLAIPSCRLHSHV